MYKTAAACADTSAAFHHTPPPLLSAAATSSSFIAVEFIDFTFHMATWLLSFFVVVVEARDCSSWWPTDPLQLHDDVPIYVLRQ